MTLLLAIILGVIQGLTEFLPVSSSGHLALFGAWLGLEQADIQFDILIHLATLVAILIVYKKDVLDLAKAPFNKDPKALKLMGMLIIVTIPAVVVGLLLKSYVEFFHNDLIWVAAFLGVTGLVLLSGKVLKQNQRSRIENLNLIPVLLIGCAQAFAILPGISRSGMTIMAGLFLGLEKEEAARFSFLMAIPAIAGAGILMVRDMNVTQLGQLWVPYAGGFIVSLLAGLVALKVLIHILKGQRFFLFGFYCLALAGVTLFVSI